jgi:pyrroline-5-carboxylate reductase
VEDRSSITIGILGTGNMGAALAKGWFRAAESRRGAGPDFSLLVWDKEEAASRRLLGADRVSVAASLRDLVSKSDVLLVVVKPKDAAEVLGVIAGSSRGGQVIVSAMGGLTLGWMREILGPGPVLMRIMPNLAVELGAGAVALAHEPGAAPETVSAVMALFRLLGLAEVVPEDLFDAITAVSGSGPAFLALAVESLEDGAVLAGLGRPVARSLVRRRMLETARLMSEPDIASRGLRQHEPYAGPALHAALDILEERQVRSAFQGAVDAAVSRARQMRGG